MGWDREGRVAMTPYGVVYKHCHRMHECTCEIPHRLVMLCETVEIAAVYK